MKNLFLVGLALCCCLVGALSWSGQPERPAVVVFAAASLSNVLQELGDGFTRESSIPVKFSFAASSALAAQIESGAPADVFFSADVDWMDYLEKRNLVKPGTRHDVLGNRLVLIAPADSTIELKIAPHFDITAALGGRRLATADPDSVPAGRYAAASLTRLGVWQDVSDHLIRAESVRAAMMFVDHGEAPLGIVYATDALIDKNVRVIDVFPDDSHAPIVYPVALTKVGGPAALRFIDYIRGPAGQTAYRAYGFVALH